MAAVSEQELKNANDWMSQTLPTRKVDKRITPTILIMQRLHQNDPTGYTLTKGKSNVRHVCLPGKLNPHVKPNALRRRYTKQGGFIDPIRMSDKVLEEVRTDLGEFGYAGQIAQHPVPLSGGMFKVDRLVVDTAPNPRDLVSLARYWDKAGSVKKRSAYTVGALMGLDNRGRLWVLDIDRFRASSSDREARIKQNAKMDVAKWRVNPKGPFDTSRVPVGVEQEPGSGGLESAEGTVRNLMGYVVHVHHPTGDKAQRADPYSVQVNQRNVHIVQAPWNADYIEELEYFPDSTYKDQVDASSGAFNMLVKPGLRATAN
jgi:predicted phage terminase large subunit-like protein